MAEVRAEHTDVIAAAISEPDDGVLLQLICDAQARSKRPGRVADVAVETIRSIAGDSDNTFNDIGKSTFPFSVHGLWEVVLPTKSIVDRQFRCSAPSVLTIEEPALLSFGSVKARADVAVHKAHVPEKESREIQAAESSARFRATRSDAVIEVQLAGAIRIAWNA